MTGAYIRVKRDGKWQNIEVEYLTDEEREHTLKDDPRLIKWLNVVCTTLTDVEDEMSELATELRHIKHG